MRKISFILAAAVLLASSSMAGSTPDRLPGVGTFAFQDAPTAVLVAAR
jgi:hypothetical protein